MEQKETLSAKQREAIALLATGRGIAETAQDVGVGRTTLWRWMRKDLNFRAEQNRQRIALKDSLADRLHVIAQEALTTVDHAISQGNVTAALAVLKGCGLLDGRWPTPCEDTFGLALSEVFKGGLGSRNDRGG